MPYLKSIYSLIRSSLVTEKSSKDLAHRKYHFEVSRDANKIEIKKAIEKIYKVKVEKVNLAVKKGKLKRIRANLAGKTSSWKKAIVTLKEGFEIKLA